MLQNNPRQNNLDNIQIQTVSYPPNNNVSPIKNTTALPPIQTNIPPKINNSQLQSAVKKKLHQKCICEMCQCGKHKCPKPKLKGIYQTSYRDHYKQMKAQRNPRLMSPAQYQPKHYAPNILKTNYQDQYYARKIKPTEAFLPALTPKKNYPLSNETEYRKRYPQYDLQKIGNNPNDINKKKIVVSPQSQPSIKFQGITSYNDHYKAFQVGNSPHNKNNMEIVLESIKSPIKFQGISHYKANYITPPLTLTKPINVVPTTRVSLPFKGISTYNDHYNQKLQNKHLNPEDHPYYQANSRHLSPKQNLFHNFEAPKFDGRTSYNQDYQLRSLPKKLRTEPSANEFSDSNNILSKKCPCEMIKLPQQNIHENDEHMRYDGIRNTWI